MNETAKAAQLSEAVKKLRKHAGLSRQKFAHRIGVGLNTVQRWEAGLSEPRYHARMELLFLAKGMKCEDLLGTLIAPDGTSLMQRYAVLEERGRYVASLQASIVTALIQLLAQPGGELLSDPQRKLVGQALDAAQQSERLFTDLSGSEQAVESKEKKTA